MNSNQYKHLPIRAVFSVILVVIFFNNTQLLAKTSSQYDVESWNKWKKDYELSLTGKSGWLSLVGLYWLTEGENSIGSAKKNQHIFPNNTPAFVGNIAVRKGKLKFDSHASHILVNGQPLKHSMLSVDDRTLVTFGNFEFYIIKREKGFAVRLIENNSNIATNFTGTRYIPFNDAWVLPAKLRLSKQIDTLKIPTVYGTIREEKSAGWLEFEIANKTYQLQAVDYGKESPMYVMFSDRTSGYTTYGAGRYVEVDWPDENGNTFIDFNRAFNPPCAYTSFATCPLTPKQNRLKIKINAGELDLLTHD